MQVLFTFVALAGLLYFCTAPRFFDWCSVAYASACVYFLPGFLGYTFIGADQAPVCSEAYLVMLAVLLGILGTAWLLDRRYAGLRRQQPAASPPAAPDLSNGGETAGGGQQWATSESGAFHFLPAAATLVALIGLLVSFRISGSLLLLENKHEMYDSFSRWHLIWLMGTSTAFIISFAQRRIGLCVVTGISLLITVYIGMRSHFAVAMIGIATVHLMSRGCRPLTTRVRTCASILALVLFIFCYKQVYIWVKLNDFAAVYQTVATEGFLSKSLLNSEPFTTQHILNVTAQEGVRIGAVDHFVYVARGTVSPFIGSSVSFGSKFTELYFHRLEHGLASNFWAEMLAAGGWGLLLAFIAVFLFVLYKASMWSRRGSCGLLGVIAAWMPWWAFYIHRNDSYRMLSFLKQFVLVLVIAWCLAWLLSAFFTPARSAQVDLRPCRRKA